MRVRWEVDRLFMVTIVLSDGYIDATDGGSFGGVLVVGLKGAGYDLCFMFERTVFSRLPLFYLWLWKVY